MAFLGEYPHGPRSEEENIFERRYAKENWDAKSWRLPPQEEFCGPTLGAIMQFQSTILNLMECFLKLWIAKIQQKLVVETNNYATMKCTKSGKLLGRSAITKQLTRPEFQKWIGICTLMAVCD